MHQDQDRRHHLCQRITTPLLPVHPYEAPEIWPFALNPSDLDRAAFEVEKEVGLGELASTADMTAIRLLAQHPARELRRRLATLPLLPPEVLDELTWDVFPPVRAAAAANPSTPIDDLQRLAEDEDDRVRLGVAHNPQAPTGVLWELTTDTNTMVRAATARHPTVPVASLVALCEDPEVDVRVAVAQADRTPPSILGLMSHDARERVRYEVACNPHTCLVTMVRLQWDPNIAVRQKAQHMMAKRHGPMSLICRDCGSALADGASTVDCPICLQVCLDDHETWLSMLRMA